MSSYDVATAAWRGMDVAAQVRNPFVTSPSPSPGSERAKTREAFTDFVGQTFFTQLLHEMRKTVEKPAYFHGGQAEEIFQGQLDQVLAEHLSDATADSFAGPMFDMFMLSRS